MAKTRVFLICLVVMSIFNATVFSILGITLTGKSDLLEISPGRKRDAKIACFVIAGVGAEHPQIYVTVAGSCGFYTYWLNR